MDDILYEITLGRERELERQSQGLECRSQLCDEPEQVECRQPGGFPKL